jgi:hypothetical protein
MMYQAVFGFFVDVDGLAGILFLREFLSNFSFNSWQSFASGMPSAAWQKSLSSSDHGKTEG